jgi:hypothetical protein
VEIFSTDTQDGSVYEGRITANQYGQFSLRTRKPFSGPFLTATSSPPGLNTSEFSPPTASMSNIQIALDAIQNEAPAYQTSFDTWGPEDRVENARLENGKLILTSEAEEGVFIGLHNLSSDRFAVEFDLRFLESGSDGICDFYAENDHEKRDSQISIYAVFGPNGQANANYYVHPDQHPVLAESRYDQTDINTVALIFLGDHLAAFVNGELAYTALDPNEGVVYARHSISAQGGLNCEFDNYTYWNLDGVDFNP